MKKRLLCFILILVMAFGATAPVYAEAWTSAQASTVTSGVTGILSMLTQLRTDIVEWMTLTGSGGQGLGATFQDQYILLSHLVDWLVPTGARGANDPTLMDSIVVLTNYAMNHLPDISLIAGYVGNWMTSNNNYLSNLVLALSTQNGQWDGTDRRNNAHANLFTYGGSDPRYNLPNFSGGGIFSSFASNWSDGTPLGNIAWILRTMAYNDATEYSSRWSADLTHYNDQLSTWDSQQDSLTQVLFTPDSAIQGLYRYLAFTQRDVARLAFILADPDEQAGMENANASGVSGMYADIYDDQNGGVTLSDLTDTFSTGTQAKQTFNTGVSFSPSGLFSFTDDGNWGFWSNAVKNDMDNVPQTRTVYDTSAYDVQLESLYKIWGLDDDK